jgi:hypothetical protein
VSNHESEKIREHMALIRSELHADVGAVVENARELTNWRGFVKRHPILSVSAAAALGFLVVPRRLDVMSPSAEALEKLAKKNRLVVKAKPDVRRQAGLVSPLLNLVGGAVMRSAFAIAGQHISRAVASPTGVGATNGPVNDATSVN